MILGVVVEYKKYLKKYPYLTTLKAIGDAS